MSPAATRRKRALGEPPADLSGFPTCDADGTWFRCHGKRSGKDKGLWYFSGHAQGAVPDGRFDLEDPRGTCYLARSEEAAAMEKCGPLLAGGAVVTREFAEQFVVSSVDDVAPSGPIANMLDPAAGRRHRVTAEMYSTTDYAVTARWAQALSAAGMGGIAYAPRFSSSHETALALFGGRGPQPRTAPVVSSEELADVLARMGVVVVARPGSQIQADDTLPAPRN